MLNFTSWKDLSLKDRSLLVENWTSLHPNRLYSTHHIIQDNNGYVDVTTVGPDYLNPNINSIYRVTVRVTRAVYVESCYNIASDLAYQQYPIVIDESVDVPTTFEQIMERIQSDQYHNVRNEYQINELIKIINNTQHPIDSHSIRLDESYENGIGVIVHLDVEWITEDHIQKLVKAIQSDINTLINAIDIIKRPYAKTCYQLKLKRHKDFLIWEDGDPNTAMVNIND